MNVEIGTETPKFLFWEYLFRNFGILSLQCEGEGTLGWGGEIANIEWCDCDCELTAGIAIAMHTDKCDRASGGQMHYDV
jgi:hypothetical protein